MRSTAVLPWGARWTPLTNLWNYTFYDIQETGVTADRPLPMPAALAEYFPAVFRGEMLYQNHDKLRRYEVDRLDGRLRTPTWSSGWRRWTSTRPTRRG